MRNTLNFYWQVLKETFQEWNSSSASKDSMSLAYSAIFSMPGLLIIVIWIAGNFFGEEAIRGEIARQIGDVMGNDAVQSIQDIIAASLVQKQSWLMKIVGIISLVFGATSLFFMLQKSLNELWDVEAAPQKAMVKFLQDRANSLGMILIIGFLMMMTMLLSTLISFFNGIITRWLGYETYALMQAANFLVGFGIVMLVFAMIYKILPDVKIKWRSVWAGAFVTAVLFTIGKFLLSLYFANVKPTSAFGTAGTVILIMMWVNYSCMLLFFGAAFTKVFSEKKGYAITPAKHAKWTAGRLYKEDHREVETLPTNL